MSVEATAADLLNGFSLEMTARDVPELESAAPIIPPGTRINITYLSTEDLGSRIEAARRVRELGFSPVPHIAARRVRSAGDLREFLGGLREVDATERVFVVGGDPAEPEGPYPDALTVIRSGLLPEFGVREVSIAGYPEGHPDITRETLDRHLADKAAALREQSLGAVLLTQFAFDVDPVRDWIRECRDRGIDAAIRVGTPGPAGIRRLLSFAKRFGVGANAMIVKKYGFSITNLLGTAGPDRFLDDLAAALAADPESGAVGVHFYTFGGLRASAEWARSREERE